MSEIWTFLLGVVLTMGTTIAALCYLQPHMRSLLAELCGTAERARFWTTFSNITLFLTPLIFALRMQPTRGPASSLIYQMCDQISLALFGLVLAIGVVGIVIGKFIPAMPVGAPSKGKPVGGQ